MPSRTRRLFTASEKLRLVKAAEAALASGECGALEAMLREEGIYSSQLSAWRTQFGARGVSGLASRTPGRKPKLSAKDRELLAVTKQNEVLQRKLRIANALIELQKKSARTIGTGTPRAGGVRRGGELMQLIEQRDPEVPVDAACHALNVSRASLYRSRRPAEPTQSQALRVRAPSPRRLDDAERQHILDTLHRPEFADQPPTEVYATLLGRGEYLASVRTMYRVLAAAGETKDRRNQRVPQQHAMPSLTATAPNQVWTWDITKLATEEKGVFLMAYVIIDLFSRFVVGWMLAAKECKHLAAQLFAETIARHGVVPGLQVHSDRGSAMKSDTLAQLLDTLGPRAASAGLACPTTTRSPRLASRP